jgi:hypothetical protein
MCMTLIFAVFVSLSFQMIMETSEKGNRVRRYIHPVKYEGFSVYHVQSLKNWGVEKSFNVQTNRPHNVMLSRVLTVL